MNKWIVLVVSALSDYVITSGTALMALDVTAGRPSNWQLGICMVGGIVAAARGVQKNISPAVQ